MAGEIRCTFDKARVIQGKSLEIFCCVVRTLTAARLREVVS